ncbi:MAG: DUF1684 domain-containing protein [Bacteroidetes bacterium]|nr:DUF1684 domain-containing protein [Bacteroidota bacterium]
MISQAQQAAQKQESDFTNEIIKQRKQKDKEFANEKGSPIPDDEKKAFHGLKYFEPDPNFKVLARLVKFDNPFHFKMKTTTDRLPEYSLYGKITFVIKGEEFNLNVYQNIDLLKKPGYENYLFIPFNDLTNGKETYGGGRFMDAEVPASDSLIIDFNDAYNPYCAYNHKYSCPIPPEDNSLQIRVEAGEMKYHD